MARRRSNNPRNFEKYPNVYARTSDTWTTRYYARKQDPIPLFGLNTLPDDYNKPQGSSPYLTNVRYMGERERQQRAPVMSRGGAKFMGTVGEAELPREVTDGTSYLEVHMGKALEWEMTHSDLLTGVSIYAYNPDAATGYLHLTVRDFDTKEEFSDGVIDITEVSQLDFSMHVMRLINAVKDSRVLVRLELLDEENTSPDDLRSVRILAGPGKHQVATYDLPNNNDALQEVAYEFKDASLIPITGAMTNDWEPLPRAYPFRSGGREYIAFPVKRSGVVELYKMDKATGAISVLTADIDSRAQAVRFAIAEGYMYYVDGYSPLRRINLTTLVSEVVVPKQAEITLPDVNPATLTAKPGASLIHFLNNRLYLSGFADDPNLVIMSLIDNVKPRFEQYNDRFYSPDQSPEASTGSPITALEDISNYLIVWRVDGLSLYDRGSSTILEDASQVTPEGSQLGVLNQEAVCKGKNNIFFFNPVEGMVRFAGSTNRTISIDIENLFKRIPDPSKVFLIYHNQRVRMYFSDNGEYINNCLYYYTNLEGRLPWYYDTNTPVSSAVVDNKSERLYAVHSQVATVYEVDAALKDFDSIIRMEYHTQYRVPATTSPDGWSYVRRLHAHIIANSTHSIYLAVDIDNQDKPAVWRRFIKAQEQPELNPDAIFKQNAETGEEVISIPMYIKCRKYQVRIVRYCYKDRAEITAISVEYGDKKPL